MSTPFLVHIGLDPSDRRALSQALKRLPSQARGADRDPLTPSTRVVLDRFLAVPLRGTLRALRHHLGPVGLVLDGLPTGIDGSLPGGRVSEIAEAIVVWIAETMGVFVVGDGTQPAGQRRFFDYSLEWALTQTEAAPILRCTAEGRDVRFALTSGRLVIFDVRRGNRTIGSHNVISADRGFEQRPGFLRVDLVVDPLVSQRWLRPDGPTIPPPDVTGKPFQ